MPAFRASPGFVGHVTFGNTPFGNITIRAESCDVHASQSIEYPEVIDGRMDRSLYQLGPKIVQGNVSFPLIHEGVANTLKNCGQVQNLGSLFWKLVAERDIYGRLKNDSMEIRVRYNDNTAFMYPNCIVNQLTMSTEQQGNVKISMDVIGGANAGSDVRKPYVGKGDLSFLSPARIVTWNDFVINVFDTKVNGGSSSIMVPGQEIRSFDVTINNNADRAYTFNGKLAPQDVYVKKRVIEGNMKILGRNETLSNLAYTNQDRFTSTSSIAFGYKLGDGNTKPYWATGLHGVIFEMEEIAISNDLIETSVKYAALGDCEASYEATQIGGSFDINNPPQGGNFGGLTSPGFPGF